ncbi:MAG: RpiB/LacA/LacB family sugar-phosphate isomerase, partial [Chloroflexi bacterium]|nr:RpiB/LacA/LacB family sugar-phosphate isomerase [Chloroflexota bacterium]
MHVAIGSDHAGVGLKAAIVDMLQDLGMPYEDFGTFDGAAVDYPDVARKVARSVSIGPFDRGIVICGTGIGAS